MTGYQSKKKSRHADEITLDHLIKLRTENERLREVVMLLIKFDEHDEDIYRGAVMWEVLIETAHAALKGSDDV